MRLWFSRYLTPWSRVLHCVKPEGALPQSLVTRFHLLLLSWIKWIQPMLSHTTKNHINILPSVHRSSSGRFMFPQGPVFISIYFNPPTPLPPPTYVPGTCDLIIKIMVMSTNHAAPHYTVFSCLLLLPPSWPNYLPQCPVFYCFDVYSFASCCKASQVPIHLGAWCYTAKQHNLANIMSWNLCHIVECPNTWSCYLLVAAWLRSLTFFSVLYYFSGAVPE